MLSRLRSSSVCRRAAFSSIATDSGSSTGSKFNFPRVKELGFETQWRNMNEAERDKVEKEHLELGKMDWHKLTFDQMRARKTFLVQFRNFTWSVYDCLWSTRTERRQ